MAFCDWFGNQPSNKSLDEKLKNPEQHQISTLKVKLVTDRSTDKILLPVIKAWVSDSLYENLRREIHLFFDSESQCSFTSNKLAHELDLPIIRKDLLMLHTFAARNLKKCCLPKVQLNLYLLDGTKVKLHSSVMNEMTTSMKIRPKGNDSMPNKAKVLNQIF